MSIPIPQVRPTSAIHSTVALNNAALLPIFTLQAARLGWAIRNPALSGQIIYLVLADIGVVATDANAEYALQPGDIMTDTDLHGYCGPIWGSSSAGAVTAVLADLR